MNPSLTSITKRNKNIFKMGIKFYNTLPIYIISK